MEDGLKLFAVGCIITAIVLVIGSVGIDIGVKNTQKEAAAVGVGRYVANPTNGHTNFEWVTNSAAK